MIALTSFSLGYFSLICWTVTIAYIQVFPEIFEPSGAIHLETSHLFGKFYVRTYRMVPYHVQLIEA